VWNDPALAPQAEAIALRIAGPNRDAKTLDCARQAQVDLNRVRSLRTQVIVRAVSSSLRPSVQRLAAGPAYRSVIVHPPAAPRRSPRQTLSGVWGAGRYAVERAIGGSAQTGRTEYGYINRPRDDQPVIHPKPLEGDAKLAAVLVDSVGELTGLDRYERRALSRRKSAIRNIDA